MIKVEHGTVQMQSPYEDMMQLINDANLTSHEASLVLTGADLAMLFHGLVDRYSLDEAMLLWTEAIEAYKQLILLKGE